MKPAFPEEVPLSMPICCRQEATQSETPQAIAPLMKNRRSCFVLSPMYFPLFFCTASFIRITGSKVALPSSDRSPMNVNGPTYSAPVLCETNELPQIMAQTVRRRLPIRLFFLFSFIFKTSR